MYTEFSGGKEYDNLYCIGEFKKSEIKVNEDALLEHEHLKQNLLSTIKINAISHNTVTAFVHHVPKYLDVIVSDTRIINNDIIGFTETQIKLKRSSSTCKIIETLVFCNINFNSNENKFLSLAYGCRNDVAVLIHLIQIVS